MNFFEAFCYLVTGKQHFMNFRAWFAMQASIGIATLLVMAMMEEGTTKHDALDKIWMVDSRGLLTKVSSCEVVLSLRSRV